jgi:aminopeptidase-like protein
VEDVKHKEEVGELDILLKALFNINRSLTGEGNRRTFDLLQEIIPLKVYEYASGTSVYDWTVPDEWVIRDAYIKGADGKKLIDFGKSNLHVMGYSTPVDQKMNFTELAPHLHYLDFNPEAIPYRTCYYERNWGFCLSKRQFQQLKDVSGPLTVFIDSAFKPDGSMMVAELLIPGKSDKEFLVSTYCCHPSMANDNLSGLLTTTYLARDLLRVEMPQRSWRFVFVPETIGAIAYLNHNEAAMKRVLGGLVVTTCGGPGALGYKETFLGDHLIDRAIRLAFRDRKVEPIRYPFVPDGSDERQYSSPGFRIPVASITKDKYYEYPQYHTSLDNLDFVNGSQIKESLDLYRDVFRILDRNVAYRSNIPCGEPQFGRRGLYPATGGAINQPGAVGPNEIARQIDAMTWLQFLADGDHDLMVIAESSGIAFLTLEKIASQLLEAGLIELCDKH